MNDTKVYTITEINGLTRRLLEDGYPDITVTGEVSNLNRHASGHIYFSLKDKSSTIRAVCFRGVANNLAIDLADGLQVVARGGLTIYEPYGSYQIVASEITAAGEGALAKALELLKTKLEKEGVFAPERKRIIPRLPQHIGLITSPDAAAYTDVLRILNNRWGGLRISFYPVQVQGGGSVNSILEAFRFFYKQTDVDTIILTRGGGSLEDLQTFNSEQVARAIYSAKIPVVVGVGHERDWTIADLVADYRAATPSNAAEIVVPDRGEILGVIDTFERTIHRGVAGELEENKVRLANSLQSLVRGPQRWQERYNALRQSLTSQFSYYRQNIKQYSGTVTRIQRNVLSHMQGAMTKSSERLRQLRKTITTLSPKATLQRGYSITFDDKGRPVRTASSVQVGAVLRSQLASGSITSTVKKPHDKDRKKRR